MNLWVRTNQPRRLFQFPQLNLLDQSLHLFLGLPSILLDQKILGYLQIRWLRLSPWDQLHLLCLLVIRLDRLLPWDLRFHQVLYFLWHRYFLLDQILRQVQ